MRPQDLVQKIEKEYGTEYLEKIYYEISRRNLLSNDMTAYAAKIENRLKENPAALTVLDFFSQKRRTVLFGGFLRDAILDRKFKDVDLVIDASHEWINAQVKNSFLKNCSIYPRGTYGGFKIYYQNLSFDLISLDSYSSMKNGIIKNEIEDVHNGAPLSCNRITYELGHGIRCMKDYSHFIQRKEVYVNEKCYSNEINIAQARAKEITKKIGFTLMTPLEKKKRESFWWES